MKHNSDGHRVATGGWATPKDPICGMSVKADSPHRVTSGGKTYLFCGAGCAEKFRSSPRKLPPSPKAEPVGKTGEGPAYTCPMHPEVRTDAPGFCPKCGMSLERVFVALPSPVSMTVGIHARPLRCLEPLRRLR